MIDDYNFMDETGNNLPSDELRVIFVVKMGKNVDHDYVYQFLVSKDVDSAWAEGWDNKPANVIHDLCPDEDMYDYVLEAKTDILLDVAQEYGCFSMQDVRDGCAALAYENLDNAEEYPEDGRIVIHFGDTVEHVEKMFARRDVTMRYV